ncbi:hypothetical protein CJF30_00002413 [Rutstroemia sp. NJR-2017a BBW]|nr:hypothetical protein CJF30_00002413 [Rutstroemia sp. NJR-2017a BBW]
MKILELIYLIKN